MTDVIVLLAILCAPTVIGILVYALTKFEFARNGYNEFNDEDFEQDLKDFVAFLNEREAR